MEGTIMKGAKRVGAKTKAQLPKTAAAAARADYKRVKVNFAELSTSDKKKWITKTAATGKRLSLVGTYRDGPSPDGGIIRCYYDPNTLNYDICHKIS
jgi:hypothetical protein